MPWGAALAAVGTVGAAALSSNAASGAAGQQVAASQAAISAQQQANAQQQARLAPFLDTGNQAGGVLANLLGLQNPNAAGGASYRETPTDINSAAFKALTDSIYAKYGVANAADRYASGAGSPDANTHAADVAAGDLWNSQQPQQNASNTSGFGSLTAPIDMAAVQADPVYASGLDFGLNQGNAAINSRALASGGYDSGATLKALARFANDYGTTKAQAGVSDIQSNRAQQYGFLSGQQAVGLNAASGANLATTNTANNIGNLTTGIGNAQAAGTVGAANAYSGIGSSLGNLYNNYQNQQLLSSLVGNNGNQAGGYNDQMNYMNGQLSTI